MNECLVTKLKASVADDSLRVLGEFRFTKRKDVEPTADNAFMQIKSESETEITILNDGYFCKNSSTEQDTTKGKSVTVPANTDRSFFISAGSEVSIAPKYGITLLNINSMEVDLSEFAYVNKISTVIALGSGIRGSVENFANIEHLKGISCGETNYKVYGNLEKIKNLAELKNISVTKSHVTGDITKCFGKSVELTTMSIADTDMTGSIDTLVAAQIAAGRSTGTIKIPFAKSCKGITFDGIALNANDNLPSLSASNQFSWTADGTITWS
jgi:hypothetical protein